MLSEPIVTATCDECGYTEEFGLTATARRGYDERNLESDMKAAGWTIVDDNTHFCPECTQPTGERSSE